jgi:starvation-inducible DNA-binding protein
MFAARSEAAVRRLIGMQIAPTDRRWKTIYRISIERWENEGGRVSDAEPGTNRPLRPGYYRISQYRRRFMVTAQLFETRIDLPVDGREKLIAVLNQQLADTFDLYGQAKQAHWNVKGPQFHSLHKLFDDLADQLEDYVDLIAERATALGGTALGTVRMAAEASRLSEYPLDAGGSMQHVEALAERFAALAATTRSAIKAAEEEDDASTADVLTEVSRGLDKSLWFLEAHLQA